jgi:hypothetical protein
MSPEAAVALVFSGSTTRALHQHLTSFKLQVKEVVGPLGRTIFSLQLASSNAQRSVFTGATLFQSVLH